MKGNIMSIYSSSLYLRYNSYRYRLSHWCFKWISDDDGDVGIRLFGFLYLIKYKEHTVIKLGSPNKYDEAGKWQGHEEEKRKAK